jgi:hypothetical protein
VARINIEDSLWKDERFQDLMIKTGNRHTAKGMLVELWALAQEYWFPDRKLIPLERIQRAGLDLVLEVGLAVQKAEGIFAVGTEKAFDWLFQKQDAGKKGGIKSGAKRALSSAKRAKAGAKHPPSETNPLTLTLSPTLTLSSSSDSNSNSEESIGVPAVAATAPAIITKADQAQKANRFVGAYVKAYQTRFPDSRPEDLNDGKTRGQILSWVKDYPLERACQLIQVYFQMDAKWFNTKGYDFLTFRNNLNKIGQALDSGKDPDGNEVDWGSVNLSGGSP